jgi:small-conductance mechanosensitive channel
MNEENQTRPEDIKKQEDVKRALVHTGTRQAPPPTTKRADRASLGGYLLLLIVVGILHLSVRAGALNFVGSYLPILQRLATVALYVGLILALTKIVEIYLIGLVQNDVSRYNLKRIWRLLSVLVLILTAVSFLFVRWYAAVVSLGLISLILGFALQTPITSFIGWIYILVREPYRVGDRIKIGNSTGDVIDVSYLDTTLWEFGGEYLSTDHPSGRIIKFPNSTILNSPVYNYSWPLFPYIWNEIKFHIAYESDLEFVATVLREVAEKEVGEPMKKRVSVFRELLAQTPVDELEVREHPAILFRVSDNTWIEAIVRYLVSPKEAGRIKTRLIREMLARLKAEPDRVLFPKSNAR